MQQRLSLDTAGTKQMIFQGLALSETGFTNSFFNYASGRVSAIKVKAGDGVTNLLGRDDILQHLE